MSKGCILRVMYVGSDCTWQTFVVNSQGATTDRRIAGAEVLSSRAHASAVFSGEHDRLLPARSVVTRRPSMAVRVAGDSSHRQKREAERQSVRVFPRFTLGELTFATWHP